MILVINTASEKNSIVLYGLRPKTKDRRRVREFFVEEQWISYQTQSQELLPRIEKLLRKCKISLKDLKAIAVFQGPGSYTGLRVGIAVANTLGWSLDIPVIGIKNKKLKIKDQKHLSRLGRAKADILKIKNDQYKALKIAKKAEEILKKKKLKKFTKIVIPYYGSKLK